MRIYHIVFSEISVNMFWQELVRQSRYHNMGIEESPGSTGQGAR